jgi:hypothetical protein
MRFASSNNVVVGVLSILCFLCQAGEVIEISCTHKKADAAKGGGPVAF